MSTHKLKILPEYYQAAASGNKPFEIRKNDRDYKLGDKLELQEWDGVNYTGKEIHVYVTYILKGGLYGLDKAYCILGTRIIEVIKNEPSKITE
ncbi:ASCH/PUA domain-containing protein [Lutibacter maritimus]|uniref:DUF3850 domain-containing protein n=1 Tax=Lutibacter maritimus TaxID=593133 RepID=A0A1I6NRP7_9FLAO|nr:ASCH/PUA domain-containing protein [Lutibacter maritimus]SFS30597.1 protein of unknown function [Lutibacter maritimus]